MAILRKSLDVVEVADIDELVATSARETGELEFKGDLPFVPTKGQPATADRWIEKGDRIGDYARDQLLAEVVAFANADGGTLVLGIHETKDEPRRAESLNPLPNCEGLAKRLLDASEDVVEPRLPAFAARALPTDEKGSGYVILRVGKSMLGPHRLTTTRDFYVRRGERSVRMTVREVKDRTLELARTGDRVESVFAERRQLARDQFVSLLKSNEVQGPSIPPLVVRASAYPTSPQIIDNLTKRTDLWWTGHGFNMKVDGHDYPCTYPAREFGDPPRIRLRALTSEFLPLEHRSIGRIVRSDGLVEFIFARPAREPHHGSSVSRLYFGWLISLVVGAIAQVSRLRTQLAWDAVEFGLEIEVSTSRPLAVYWNEDIFGGMELKTDLPLLLPRYSLPGAGPDDALINELVHDVRNACGISGDVKCEVPWAEILN